MGGGGGVTKEVVFGMPQDITTTEMFRRLIRLQKYSPIIAKLAGKSPSRASDMAPSAKIEQLMIS